MPVFDEKYDINLDINRQRIKTILAEAYNICKTFLSADFEISQEEFVKKLDPYLDSNRITIPVTLDLGSSKCHDLRIEVDIRKKSVFARTRMKPKQIILNRYLTTL